MIESDTTELIRELNDKLEKEVVAFLNTKGGDIFIGVDNEGGVVGVEDADHIQLVITDRIKKNILPSSLGLFEVYAEEIDNKSIVHIRVSAGLERPYYIKQYGMSPLGCYLRIGSGIKQMEPNMIDRLFASRTRNSLRSIPSPRFGEHTFAQLKIYYEEKGYSINDAFLRNLDLFTPNGKINYIGYLLADENSVSFKVAKFAGNNKNELIENEEFGYCSILKATKKILDKLDIENKTFTSVSGAAQRQERRMVDSRALREALINAVVHNDYTREVSPVVEIYSDHLSIVSYGGLVEGLSEEDFFNGRSMPRNRELMRVFRDMQLVEHLGTGMGKILTAYDRSIFHISENFIEIAFPYKEAYSDIPATESDATPPVTPPVAPPVNAIESNMSFTLKQMVLLLEGEMSKNDLMQSLGLKDTKYFKQNILQKAIKLNLIELTQPNSPNSPTQKYRLTPVGESLKKSLFQQEK